MSLRLQTIIYNNSETQRAYYVHRLNRPVVNLYGASRVLELLDRSYTDNFEGRDFQGPSGPLPSGSIKKQFAGGYDANAKQMNRMNQSIANGSTYWYVNPDEKSPTDRAFNESAGGYVAGLVKTSPSRATAAQRLHLEAPNCYVNDIVVDPELQRRVDAESNHHIGSMLLHAALKFGNFKPRAKLALDSYVGNDIANTWFERLGLQSDPTSQLTGWAVNDGLKLSQIRFTSQPNMSILDHVQALEQSATWLGHVSLVVTT